MKVGIITTGGKDIGFGHISRCRSLADELNKMGIVSTFIVNDDQSLQDILTGYKVQTFKLGNNGIQQMFPLVEGLDVLVIDSYKIKEAIYHQLREKTKYMICFDDYQRIDYPADMVINAAIDVKRQDYGVDQKTYLLGLAFFPIRAEFLPQSPKIIHEKINNILITFGGDDRRELTARVRDLVLDSMPHARLHVVVGHAFAKKQDFLKDQNNRVRYHFQANAKTMSDLMRQADLAITACGQTLYELAYTGTPTVGISVADNQKNNIAGWTRNGFLKFCGPWDDENLLNNLKMALQDFTSKEKRKSAAALGQRLIDGQGAKRIAERILALTQEGTAFEARR